jgi:hypothetical protein
VPCGEECLNQITMLIWKLNLKVMTGDDISDGDAEILFCTVLFLHDKHGEKWAQCVRCYRWAHEDCGVEEDCFV